MNLQQSARALLGHYFRDRTATRRLPKQFEARPIVVSPDASLRFLLPGARGFDKMLSDLVDRFVVTDSVAWDICANVGAFSFPAAVRARRGRVLAVEPDPFLSSLLRRTLALPQNRDLRVDVLPVAVSDRCGLTNLAIARGGRATNWIDGARRPPRAGSRAAILAPTLSLDALNADYPSPSIVKIDVEGAEHMVLAGATELLAQVRPIIIVETAGANQDIVTTVLRDNDYLLFDANASSSRVVERCAYNTLALPKERAGR